MYDYSEVDLVKVSSVNDEVLVGSFPVLAKGESKVWYLKSESEGSDWLRFSLKTAKDKGVVVPTLENIENTHGLLGEISATEDQLEDVFSALNHWSMMVDASDVIDGAGLSHTSMSVGDIVQVGEKLFFVDMVGFVELGVEEKKIEVEVELVEDKKVVKKSGDRASTGVLVERHEEILKVLGALGKTYKRSDFVDTAKEVLGYAIPFNKVVREVYSKKSGSSYVVAELEVEVE